MCRYCCINKMLACDMVLNGAVQYVFVHRSIRETTACSRRRADVHIYRGVTTMERLTNADSAHTSTEDQ